MRWFGREAGILAAFPIELADFNHPLTIHRANSAYLAASARG